MVNSKQGLTISVDTYSEEICKLINKKDRSADVPSSFIDCAYDDELTIEQAVDSWFAK
tara:strand:- start:1923 stop:2096 length:174 start_codon:yes stop_codon:yes gene_type:complete